MLVDHFADQLRKTLHDLRGGDVSHGLGHGSEARQVEKRDREPQLRGCFAPFGATGILRQMHQHVLAQCGRHAFTMKVEQRGLNQLTHGAARGLCRVVEFQT